VRALLHNWHLAPPLADILAAGTVYALGMRNGTGGRRSSARAGWFASGLLVLVVAFASPLAAFDDRLFWAHMLQHVLLLVVAPPLIVLGRPGTTCWRALPLGVRRRAARAALHSPAWAPLRAAVRVLTAPRVALGAFCATMAVWHVPALYGATLRSLAVHEVEHALFLAAGLLLWSALIDSPPLRSRLSLPARALYASSAMGACWVLALVLGLAASPLYADYAAIPSRPGGISALADQHLAAGIMWVPGSIPFVVAVALLAYRWLDAGVQERSASVAGAAP
jgi:putative membrane protein